MPRAEELRRFSAGRSEYRDALVEAGEWATRKYLRDRLRRAEMRVKAAAQRTAVREIRAREGGGR